MAAIDVIAPYPLIAVTCMASRYRSRYSIRHHRARWSTSLWRFWRPSPPWEAPGCSFRAPSRTGGPTCSPGARTLFALGFTLGAMTIGFAAGFGARAAARDGAVRLPDRAADAGRGRRGAGRTYGAGALRGPSHRGVVRDRRGRHHPARPDHRDLRQEPAEGGRPLFVAARPGPRRRARLRRRVPGLVRRGHRGAQQPARPARRPS